MHVVESKVQTMLSFTLEEEKARQSLGIPLETYNDMVGTRRWVHLSPYQYGVITCKADVLAAFRVLTRTSAVENQLVYGKGK